ncbi:ATP-binding cassette, subfamily B, MsbA [Syntrophus gentianae]|uniref:ATP-binding cassette, subfamily B, MsbA n=1 Tax=Syntrophus gentianae TaxID=43775 RepID=A0A1H7WBB2_9BACT|nr:lipid A export permease/ATP-binding protein MsbA [Syntrophus gentianae]SEM18227.1 ATP-binding cassette, subfamily B, MsbA [Syntrophus gentianae]
MDIFKRLLKLTRPHIPRFALAMVCMLIVGALTSALAFLVKPALDDIFLKKNAEMLKWIPLAVILIYIVKGSCSYFQTILMNFIGQRIVADLRYRLYEQIQKQSLNFFAKHHTGELMSRITNDVTSIQHAVAEAVTSILKDSFTLLSLVFVIFYRDWQLATIAMFVFPLTIYPVAKFGEKMRKNATKTQVTMAGLTTLLQETISGTRIVKAFCMEAYENMRFAKENEKLMRLALKSVSINAISSPFMEFLGGIGIAAIIFYGGYQVIHGTSTPGTFFSFLTALIMLYEPVKRLTNVNNTVQKGIAGAERVYRILDLVPEILDRENAVDLPRIAEEIEIRNVSFAYNETPVLRNISLTIRAGEVVAFVGMSGGGKTTLVNLIPRFYDVSTGQILIDGQDIRDVSLLSLRRQIGIVTQQTILFNDTVRNNISYGSRESSDEELFEAAKAANAHEFIKNLPEGYDTVIGEQGTKLSGGERQRISIARALLKNAPILILDEATSSLDTEAEMEVQEALERLMKGRTTLVIAHRLSTIRNADRIVVLVKGEIVEEGSHEALLARQGEYYKLHQLQFKENKVGEGIGLK